MHPYHSTIKFISPRSFFDITSENFEKNHLDIIQKYIENGMERRINQNNLLSYPRSSSLQAYVAAVLVFAVC